MNTSKQVNVMIGLLFVGALATLLYFLWDSERQGSALERQMEENAERGGFLFSRNCSSCHGLTGKGAFERTGLPGAELNNEDKRPTDSADLEGPTGLHSRFRDTIACGRVGTLMPSWSQAQGGPLNDFQIQQLVTLITGTFPGEDPLADPNAISELGWEFAFEQTTHDSEFSPPKELVEAVDADVTTLTLNDAGDLQADQTLRIDDAPGDEVYEIVKVVSVSEDDGEIEVERGAEGSDAAEHAEGTEVFNGPIPPGTTVTGETGTAPCGQAAAGPAATPGPPVSVTGTVSMSMFDNFFDLNGQQNPTLSVRSGDPITVQLANAGTQVHNMVIAGADGEFGTDDDIISDPAAISGGGSGTLVFTISQPETYLYQCDFHPGQMSGEITVTQ